MRSDTTDDLCMQALRITNWQLPLAATINGRWHMGLGDPTFSGWAIAILYFAATIACWMAARKCSETMIIARWWQVCAVVMSFLGINKQLDLQTLFTQLARDAFRAEGWYDQRRAWQVAFIILLPIISGVVLATVAFVLRKHLSEIGWALAGLVVLATFVVIRAASFHHVDALLRWQWAGTTFNTLLEGIGILCVGVPATYVWLHTVPKASEP